MARSSGRRTGDAPPRVDTAVARFMLGSLAAIAVIVVGGFFALRNVAIDEAEGDTRDRVRAEARLVEAAGLSDAIIRGDPPAIRRLDDLVQAQILGGPIVAREAVDQARRHPVLRRGRADRKALASCSSTSAGWRGAGSCRLRDRGRFACAARSASWPVPIT